MSKKRITIIICAELLFVVVVCLLFARHTIYSPRGESGWYTYNNSTYYAMRDGKKARGYELIDGKPYYFNWQGKVADKGWIEDTYYCLGHGELATGWKYIGKRAFYFYQKTDNVGMNIGRKALNYTTSGGITVPKTGYLEGDEAKAIGYAINVLDRYGWNLEAAYKYSSSLRFVRNADEQYGYRIHKCAIQGFEYGEGNCLSWAGSFCAMAKVLGYDCRLIWGTLQYRGKDVVHGWSEIWGEDGPHVYDPRHNSGKDLSGFNVHYGDPGTYRYNEDSKKYLEW